jgi:hypothetical protein
MVSLASDRDRTETRLPPVLGIIGTLVVCSAALMGHLSPPVMKSAAPIAWIVGLAIQAAAFGLALAGRRLTGK